MLVSVGAQLELTVSSVVDQIRLSHRSDGTDMSLIVR